MNHVRPTLAYTACLLLSLSWLAGSSSAASVITRYQYDNASRVRRVSTETGGQALSDKRMVYDELGRVKSTRELANPVAGEVILSDHPGEDEAKDRISETAWDVAGNVVLERRRYAVDPRGYATTTHAYDSLSRKTGMTDAEGHTTAYGCDMRGNVVSEIDPAGNLARFFCDAAGQQILEKHYEGTSTPALQINRVHDSRGHKIIEIQGDGQAGETFEQALPTALTQQRWQYDALDRLVLQIQVGDPYTPSSFWGRLTKYTYVAATKNPYQRITYTNGSYLARYTLFEYDPLGRPTKITDPNGNTDEYTYVPTGQDGEGKVETRKVTNPGLTDPAGADISTQEFTYTYDERGRKLIETVKGLGEDQRRTSCFYDDVARVQRVTNSKGIVTEDYSNAFGDQVKVVEDVNDLARTTETEYDQLGRTKSQKATNTGGQEQVTSYEYDLLGHRKRVTLPNTPPWLYDYDDAGRLRQRIDPRGQVTHYVNNWRGQPLTKAVQVSVMAPAELKESFCYYPTGWLKAAWMNTATLEEAGNKSEFVCDAFGQVTSVTQTIDGVSKTIDSAYFPSGARKQLSYPADVRIYPADARLDLEFEEDQLGQIDTIWRNGNPLATYGYAGRKLLWRDVRTAGSNLTDVRFEVGLDAYRQQARLTNRTVVGGTSTVLDQTDYTYDPAGNRETAAITAGDQRLTQTAGKNGYGYDSLDRLITAIYPAGQSETFSLDLLGNRTDRPPGYTDRQGRQTHYTANEVNEYTSVTSTGGGTQTPQYDAAGNLTANEYGYQFVYDHENRLIEVKDKEAGHPTLASYTYDALGHRVKQVKGNQTTRYYYDGETILAEYDGAGNLLRYHIHGPTYVDEHVVLHEMAHDQQPEGEYYYLLGTLYSVTGLVDATGAVAERYRYDAYGLPTCLGAAPSLRDFIAFQAAFSGNQSCQPGSIHDYNRDGKVDLTDYRLFFDGIRANLGLSPYRFTGQRLDLLVLDDNGRPVLALYNYRAREYDAYHGRFLQRDPAEYEDAMNLYEYVKSEPLIGADPTGEVGTYVDLLADMFDFAMEAKNAYDTGNTIMGMVQQVIAGADLRTVALNAALEAAGNYAAGKAFDATLSAVTSVGKTLAANMGKAPSWLGPKVGDWAARASQSICFVEGTPVQTPDGLVPIEQIHPGDLVVTRDQFRPEEALAIRSVKEVFTRVVPAILWITLANGDTLGTTPEHVIWTREGGWTLARDLRVGQNLVTDSGDVLQITTIVDDPAPARTYNLNVDETHTYFVGTSRVWVHNACRALGETGQKISTIAKEARPGQCERTAEQIGKALGDAGHDVTYIKLTTNGPMKLIGTAEHQVANNGYHYAVFDNETGLVFDKFYPNGIPVVLYKMFYFVEEGADLVMDVVLGPGR